ATLPNLDLVRTSWFSYHISRRFWPGQFVKVRLVLTVHKDAVLVPISAPQLSQQGNYVYVVNAESKAELRPVILGQQQTIGHDEFVVVEKGVNAGERVVVNGQLAVAPGAPVKIEGSKDASGGKS